MVRRPLFLLSLYARKEGKRGKMDHYVILDYIYERDTKHRALPLSSRGVYTRGMSYISILTLAAAAAAVEGPRGKMAHSQPLYTYL